MHDARWCTRQRVRHGVVLPFEDPVDAPDNLRDLFAIDPGSMNTCRRRLRAHVRGPVRVVAATKPVVRGAGRSRQP